MAECDICGKRFDTEHGVRIHQAKVHPVNEDVVDLLRDLKRWMRFDLIQNHGVDPDAV